MTTRDKGYHVGFRLGEWLGYALGLITLLGLFAGSVAWVNGTNEKVAKIPVIERQFTDVDDKVQLLCAWARLVDSTKFKLAEQLTK